MTKAMYPGSFDPLTNGHLDIAARAAKLFDSLLIAVYDRPAKRLLFTTQERVKLARDATAHIPNIKVTSFEGLMVEFARKSGAEVIVRGLRMSSDFEFEFEMAMMNKKLAPDLDLVCLMTRNEFQFLSSSMLKDVASLGGCIDGMVPQNVAGALEKKLSRCKPV
ncbi:MAG: pantetheine-phosphate adenylyltransferase [Chloroflexi bacterium]|nr:pantetheine-phosphate adenylyltransferase [Chloroflexota bacterium]